MILLQAAENLINQALAYDNSNGELLQPLAGTIAKVSVSTLKVPDLAVKIAQQLSLPEPPPQLVFYALLKTDQLILTEDCQQEADVSLSGNPSDLLNWLKGGTNTTGVNVSGDLGILKQIQTLLKSLDIDWESMLADQIGDFPVALLSSVGKEIKQGLDALRPGARPSSNSNSNSSSN